MGFQEDIITIQDQIPNDDVQSMIFSATVPDFIAKLAADSMDKPVMIDLVGSDTNQLPSQLVSKAIISPTFQHKIQHIKAFVKANPGKKMIIFTETKQDA